MTQPLTSPALSGIPSIRHGFFTRETGDCGWPRGAGEAAAIARNRAKVALALGMPPERLLSCRQVHSATVVTLEPEGFPNGIIPEADAMVTNHARLALGILTADCGPVLFADPEAHVIGAAHAGWRGAIGGVLENTISAMEKLGAKRKRLLAAIGPCIGPNSYEVDPEFPAPFLAEDPENEKFFRPLLPAFPQAQRSPLPLVGRDREGGIQQAESQDRIEKPCRSDIPPPCDRLLSVAPPPYPSPRGGGDCAAPYLFDLPGYIQNKLQKIGLNAVSPSPADTCADPERFFSYRRACQSGNPVTGRLLSAIVLTE